MRKICLTFLGLALAVAVGACGDDDAASESGSRSTGPAPAASAPFAKDLEQARQPMTTFPGPDEAPGPVPEGKKLALVQVVSAPFPDNLVKGTEEAAKAVGWSTRKFNAQGTPQGIQTSFATALGTKPDAIVLAAMPAEVMKPQIAEATKAGVPVLALSPGMTEGTTPESVGLINQVQYDAHRVGQTLGQWVVNRWPDGATVLALTSPEFPDLTLMSENFRKVVTDAESEFKVGATVASPITDIGGGQEGVNRLASPIKRFPDAKAMYINSESWFSTFLQATKVAAGGTKIVGLGADGDVSIPLVKTGTPIVMMGADSTTYGWYGVDSLVRHFNDKPQPTYEVPLRLVDSVNAGSIETEGIRVDFDNAAEWTKLWGIG